MLKTPPEIISTLEEAVSIAKNGNMELAKVMVVASKHAIQALALDFMRRKLRHDAIDAIGHTKKLP